MKKRKFKFIGILEYDSGSDPFAVFECTENITNNGVYVHGHATAKVNLHCAGIDYDPERGLTAKNIKALERFLELNLE